MTLLQSLNPDAQSLLLIILLVIAFVVAFKIMEMIFETLLVSVFSAVFYLALAYFFRFSLSFDRLLLFAFLGASFYMFYSFLASAYTIASTVIGVPYTLLKMLWLGVAIPLEKFYSESKKLWDALTEKAGEIEEKRKSGGKDNERDVKEVVLDKVKDEED